jgi:hypothetical protein
MAKIQRPVKRPIERTQLPANPWHGDREVDENLGARVAKLAKRVNNLREDVDALQAAMDALDARVTALEGAGP